MFGTCPETWSSSVVFLEDGFDRNGKDGFGSNRDAGNSIRSSFSTPVLDQESGLGGTSGR